MFLRHERQTEICLLIRWVDSNCPSGECAPRYRRHVRPWMEDRRLDSQGYELNTPGNEEKIALQESDARSADAEYGW